MKSSSLCASHLTKLVVPFIAQQQKHIQKLPESFKKSGKSADTYPHQNKAASRVAICYASEITPS